MDVGRGVGGERALPSLSSISTHCWWSGRWRRSRLGKGRACRWGTRKPHTQSAWDRWCQGPAAGLLCREEGSPGGLCSRLKRSAERRGKRREESRPRRRRCEGLRDGKGGQMKDEKKKDKKRAKRAEMKEKKDIREPVLCMGEK